MSSINKALAALEAAKKERQKAQTQPQSSQNHQNSTSSAPVQMPQQNDNAYDALNKKPEHDQSSSLKDSKDKVPSKQTQAFESIQTPTAINAVPVVESPKPTTGHFIETPTFTRVDLSIAGTPHRISCPTSEVEALNKTAETLNQSLRLLRTNLKGKSPNNEELLVLHCLELYDRLYELEEDKKQLIAQENEASLLIDRILKSAQAIL